MSAEVERDIKKVRESLEALYNTELALLKNEELYSSLNQAKRQSRVGEEKRLSKLIKEAKEKEAQITQ
jgi:hypothetical protein